MSVTAPKRLRRARRRVPRPAARPIPLLEPEISGREWDYVKSCLDEGWVSSAGSFVSKFEEQTAARAGCRYAVATSSGTAALHVALRVAGVQPDDEVIVPSLTFVATANAVRYVGARPVFMDVDPFYWQLDPDLVRRFFKTKCRYRNGAWIHLETGRPVRAMIPVHALGHPSDMDALIHEAREHELIMIEDATEALGASYKDRLVGSLGDIGCFSFNGNKIVTTGGGGMITTNRSAFARKAHTLTTQSKSDPIEYIHDEVGFNYRLSNIQAAIGCAQLERLDEFIAAKRVIASRYDEAFRDVIGITALRRAPWAQSVCWLYTVLCDPKTFGCDSRELMRRMESAGIQTRPLWQPLHLSPAHRGCPHLGGVVAERIYREGLSLPCSVGLSPDDQRRVIDVIRRIRR